MKRPKDAGTSPWRKRSPSSSTAASARPDIPSSAKKPSEADGEKTGILPAFFYCFKWLARAPVRRFSFFAGDAGLNHDKKVFSHADADPHCGNKEFPARCGPAIQVRTCPNIYDDSRHRSTNSMVATFLLLQRRMESSKGRSCRPVEKEPVGRAGCRSVCNSLRTSIEKEDDRAACRRNSTNCGTRQPAPPPAVLREPHRLFF